MKRSVVKSSAVQISTVQVVKRREVHCSGEKRVLFSVYSTVQCTTV